MLSPYGTGDLNKRYRPIIFDNIVGQKEIVSALRGMVLSPNTPQSFLFHGDSGVGKTTLARIMARSLNCSNLTETGNPCNSCPSCLSILEGNHPDVQELNSANRRKIDDIRELERWLDLYPIASPNKILILDECHQITKDGQEALLTPLENPSLGVYIFLCSTEPKKLKVTIRNRCLDFKFNRITNSEIELLVRSVSTYEVGKEPDPKVLDGIVEIAAGRPRNALNLLQVALEIGLENSDELLRMLSTDSDFSPDFRNFVFILMKPTSSWSYITSAYKGLNIEAPDLQRLLAGWMRASLLRNSNIDKANILSQALGVLIEPLPVVKPENGLVYQLFQLKKIFSA